MLNEKKCPVCGKWSQLNEIPDDVCVHCGKNLNEYSIQKEERLVREQEIEKKDFLTIKPSDSFPLVILKKILTVANIIFMAFISFILWLVTVVTG